MRNEFGWHVGESRSAHAYLRKTHIKQGRAKLEEDTTEAMNELASEERLGPPDISGFNRLQNSARRPAGPVTQVEIGENGFKPDLLYLVPKQEPPLDNTIKIVGLM